jgi:hypothetical protein
MELAHFLLVGILLYFFGKSILKSFKYLLVVVAAIIIWNNLDLTVKGNTIKFANTAYQTITNYSPTDLQKQVNGALGNLTHKATIRPTQPDQCPTGNQTYISCPDCTDQQTYCLTISATGKNCYAKFLTRLGMFQYTGAICNEQN